MSKLRLKYCKLLLWLVESCDRNITKFNQYINKVQDTKKDRIWLLEANLQQLTKKEFDIFVKESGYMPENEYYNVNTDND